MSLENIVSEMAQYKVLTWDVYGSSRATEDIFSVVNEFLNQTGFYTRRNEHTRDFEILPFLRPVYNTTCGEEIECDYEYPDGRIRLSNDHTKLLVINDYGPWLLISHEEDDLVINYKFTVSLDGSHIGYCEDPKVMIGRILSHGFIPQEETKRLNISEEDEEQLFPILVEFPQHVFIKSFQQGFFLE